MMKAIYIKPAIELFRMEAQRFCDVSIRTKTQSHVDHIDNYEGSYVSSEVWIDAKKHNLWDDTEQDNDTWD